MLIAAMTLLSSVVVLYLYHNAAVAPPLWLQKLAFNVLAPAVCWKTTAKNDITLSKDSTVADGNKSSNSSTNCPRNSNNVGSATSACETEESRSDANQFPWPIQEAIASIRNLTRTINAKINSNARRHRQVMIWREIAGIFDRVFFIFYIVLTFIVSVILLGIYPQTVPKTTEAIPHGQ
jgi:hypothetical protein